MSLLHQLADRIAAHRPADRALIVGITGAVAAGKSTLARELKAALTAQPKPPRVEIVGTDGFLRPNTELTEMGLLNQKGFPASYDTARLHAALFAIRTGWADFPAYSHVAYDIDPALTRTLASPDILLVEGLNLHHRTTDPTGPDPLDLLIYLDADEADLWAWFLARFMGLWEAAEHDASSFYRQFRTMDRPQTEAFAHMVWTQINLKNLHEHISRAKTHADIVVRKTADHRISIVEPRATHSSNRQSIL